MNRRLKVVLSWTVVFSYLGLNPDSLPCRKTQMKRWGSSCTIICICRAKWVDFSIVLHISKESEYKYSGVLSIFPCVKDLYLGFQVEDPAMRWQMSLYKEMAGKAEDAEDPEKVVKRVQEVSAVLYHIEVVSLPLSSRALYTLMWHYLVQLYCRKNFCKFLEKDLSRRCLSFLQTEHPFKSKKMVWHKLLSKQRRRAVVACFRMTPLYNIPT